MVSCRPHNFFDTASYTKPLRFQIYLATFLNFTQKHFEKVSVGEFYRKIPGPKLEDGKIG